MEIEFDRRLAELERPERLGPKFSTGEFWTLATVAVIVPVAAAIIATAATR